MQLVSQLLCFTAVPIQSHSGGHHCIHRVQFVQKFIKRSDRRHILNAFNTIAWKASDSLFERISAALFALRGNHFNLNAFRMGMPGDSPSLQFRTIHHRGKREVADRKSSLMVDGIMDGAGYHRNRSGFDSELSNLAVDSIRTAGRENRLCAGLGAGRRILPHYHGHPNLSGFLVRVLRAIPHPAGKNLRRYLEMLRTFHDDRRRLRDSSICV